MLSPLRNRFGIPGVISVIALVFAMLGGAYAASNNSGGKATASAKAKKGPRGPKGATGPAGPQGPQGPAGPAGAKGDAGANGSNGAAGPTGPAGAKGATGATGATGAAGQTGFTETLPSGKTETGVWGFAAYDVKSEQRFTTSISFPIPISTTVKVVYLNGAETQTEAETGGCKWEQHNPAAKPEAPAGTLCAFAEYESKAGSVDRYFYTPGENLEEGRAGPAGSQMVTVLHGSSELPPVLLEEAGVWAVTAP